MRKVQVLFSDPHLRKLRELAKREDRPLSEIIRRATEAYLERLPYELEANHKVQIPVLDGGRTLASPANRFDWPKRSPESPDSFISSWTG